MKKRLYLIDVSSMFFRAFYAIRQLNNPQGMPTNAIYGFMNMTVKLLREIKPDYMAFCFDRPEPSFRKDIDPRYKANRSDMPEDLVPQVPYIRKVSHALGVACFDKLGFEADDIIGTLAWLGRDEGLEVVIVSGDKDFGQLVGPHVTMYDTMKDIRYDEAGVKEKFGVEPRKMRDYLALVGDSSDNIPGVKGIGPKGAQTLLEQFDSLKDIYDNLDKISNKNIRAKLEAARDEAFLSYKLVCIVTDMDLDTKVEDLKLKPIVRDELRALLDELDFKNMKKTLLGDNSSPEASAALPDMTGKNMSDHLSPAESPASANPARNQFVRSVKPTTGAAAVASYDTKTFTETEMDVSALDKWLKPKQETWGFKDERGVYLSQGDQVTRVSGDTEKLGEMLREKNLIMKGYDLKEFAKEVKMPTIDVNWDQMLAAYVVKAGNTGIDRELFQLYNRFVPPDLATPGEMLNAHLELEQHLRRKLKSLASEKVLFEIELPLIDVLLRMENKGIALDKSVLAGQSKTLTAELKALETDIHKEAGETFNIGSPKQLAHVLFEKLKMPAGKKTKTGYSTDNSVLEKLADEFPLARKIVEYREIAKLKSTYVDSLPLLVNEKTGRLHSTFNQASTATGRLSSVNPNLQNIPIRTQRGNLIRRAFVADKGNVLISADYSQVELRILAHVADDPGLIAAFNSGVDIHTATAAEVFSVKIADVTPDMRRKAKAVNFGLAYGQGAFGLAEALGIPRKEATEIITRYFQRFNRVQTYMTDTIEVAKKQGYVETLYGRRRYLDELYSSSSMVKKFGERAAINAPIQGTASDLVKKAMIEVDKANLAPMLLQVHDELIFETDAKNAEKIGQQVQKQMCAVNPLKVPLEVNVGTGPNWDDAHS